MEGSRSKDEGGTPACGEALCVIWHPRGSRPDPELLTALHGRGFRTICCDSPIEATAWVCMTSHARGERARREFTGPLVLLLDRPGLLLGGEECREAVESYAPSAVCWIHDPTGTPRLRAATPPARASMRDPERAVGSAGLTVGGGGVGGERCQEPVRVSPVTLPRALRLAGVDESFTPSKAPPGRPERQSLDEAPEPDRASTRSMRDLLTDEELSMLLNDDRAPCTPEQGPHHPGRHHP